MKTIIALACLVAFAVKSFGYDEKIERSGDEVRASFVASPASAASGPTAQAPVPGNFYAFKAAFPRQDLSCDELLAKIHALISDWNAYPRANLYALSFCPNANYPKAPLEFIYAVDAWRPDAVSEVQAFLRDHQGRKFEGKKLKFSKVVKLDVKTVLILGKVGAKGSVAPVHSAEAWTPYPGTPEWFPENYERGKIVAQSDLGVFLAWVGKLFGAAEQAPFTAALAGSDFVQFSDFFRLNLADGQQADFWLAFGGMRRCGAQPCFANKPGPAPGPVAAPAFD